MLPQLALYKFNYVNINMAYNPEIHNWPSLKTDQPSLASNKIMLQFNYDKKDRI